MKRCHCLIIHASKQVQQTKQQQQKQQNSKKSNKANKLNSKVNKCNNMGAHVIARGTIAAFLGVRSTIATSKPKITKNHSKNEKIEEKTTMRNGNRDNHPNHT